MINIYSDLISAWPASVVLAPKLSRLTPSFAQVWDYERISPASAVGGTVKSVQGAVGEYLERRHFFNEIRAVSQKTLHEMMPRSFADAFINAFVQTSSAEAECIADHRFATVHAFNAFTLEQIEVPAVIVALDNITASGDLEFYPSRDTCGCCCHISLAQAINGALSELIERQSLLLYWLTGKANYELILDSEIGVNYVDELIKNLVEQGELKILDVTMPGAPGYAILTLYGTRNEQSTIKYSTGLSYAVDLRAALHKSMIELWQSYICMHNFIIGDYSYEGVIDKYQKHFISCNKYSTYTELYQKTDFRCVSSLFSEQSDEHYTTVSMTDFLEGITPNLFIYYARDRMSNGMLWYTKAFSPDLFLHMDNSCSMNINNNIYSPGSGIHERENTMVPFP